MTGSDRAVAEAERILALGFGSLPQFDPDELGEPAGEVLAAVAERLQDNFPYHHPLYAGQMLKPPHPLAREAYHLAMRLNPNNHALDGGRASSLMEKEAVAELAAMIGWPDHLGHLTSGGTMANLEALWVSRQLHPDRLVCGSTHAHYTHERISGVLGVEFRAMGNSASSAADGWGGVCARSGGRSGGSLHAAPANE